MLNFVYRVYNLFLICQVMVTSMEPDLPVHLLEIVFIFLSINIFLCHDCLFMKFMVYVLYTFLQLEHGCTICRGSLQFHF